MKTSLFILLLSVAFTSKATILTVNNNPGGAQYTNLQNAINAASQGDTIYLHGSLTSYGDATVNDKKLVFIGPGIEPDVTPNLRASVGLLRIHNQNTTDCNGSVIMGLNILQALEITAGYGQPLVNYIKVIRNRFANSGLMLNGGPGYIVGNLVEGNFFLNSSVNVSGGQGISNCLFINNVFCQDNTRNGNTHYILSGFDNTTNVVFDHNVFYNNGMPNVHLFFSKTKYVIFKNNIFSKLRNDWLPYNSSSEILECQFQNNLTFDCTNNTLWNLNDNIDSGGNIANQDPQMGSQTDINNGVGSSLLDFSIVSGVANNAGTDGKDLGVLFDTNTYMNWTNGRNSRLPYIKNMMLDNTTVTQGGTLHVQITTNRSN